MIVSPEFQSYTYCTEPGHKGLAKNQADEMDDETKQLFGLLEEIFFIIL